MDVDVTLSEAIFLSHLSGDEEYMILVYLYRVFLSHLSGDEEYAADVERVGLFLSHLSGDEVSVV